MKTKNDNNWSLIQKQINHQGEKARQFYRVYPIASTVRSQLNWSQYRMLIQIEDTVVKMALPEDNSTILASKYQLYLPTTEQLIKEIDEENNSQPEIYAALLRNLAFTCRRLLNY